VTRATWTARAPLYERAVSVFEARLGSQHPATAQCRKGLADVVTLLERQP
jgi:hypothetical protein